MAAQARDVEPEREVEDDQHAGASEIDEHEALLRERKSEPVFSCALALGEPGLPARIVTQRKDNVVLVPRRAVQSENGVSFVLVPTAGQPDRATGTPANTPPSMTMVCPVMKPAAGEARNTAAPAISSGSPIRCNGVSRVRLR